ncbi:MAG TPA: cytochrome-c oxidase, cbb3-type subunit III [Devosia sp.]|nr:cytochrome-c oxidase, cbb3-type subunit III [Devosia sp.]
MSDKPEVDEISGTETTGHEWDGIKELNTPLPRWWLWTFYATIIWAVGYMIAMPAIPLVNSFTPGVLGYTSRGAVANDIAAAKEGQAEFFARIDATELTDIIGDEELARFARAGGSAAFKLNCSQCHGSGAQGFVGYPNLNDDEWLWGGTIEDIYTTINHGIRYEADFDTRFSEMSAFGKDDILTNAEIHSVAQYTAFLGGFEGGEKTAEGEELFLDNCSGCHGETGAGDIYQGAPALNNAIFQYAGSLDAIVSQIDTPQHGVMPAWGEKLGDVTVKQLAVYVHSLGGGQ